MPSGHDEVQRLFTNADGGQFRLSYRGQVTGDIAAEAPLSVLEAKLQALSSIGPSNIIVSRVGGLPTFTFTGALSQKNAALIGIENGTEPMTTNGATGPLGFEMHTTTPGGNAHRSPSKPPSPASPPAPPITQSSSPPTRPEPNKQRLQTSFPPSSPRNPAPTKRSAKKTAPSPSPNAAPMRRSPPPARKASRPRLTDYAADTVLYNSFAGNLAGSGSAEALNTSQYVAVRTARAGKRFPS